MEEGPIKAVDNRNPDGTFGPGNNANPNGRPKGKTIKERVLEWLETHPDDMTLFVEHFVKKNRDLAWQMLEGRPKQNTDVTSDGEALKTVLVQFMDGKQPDNHTDTE